MKKRFLTTLFFLVSSITFLMAQTPERMSYQSVLRDARNQLVTNRQVGMQISILHNSPSGTAVYVEQQTATTNAHGLVSVEIGTGHVISGAIATIQWENGTYYIRTEIDLNGGSNYTYTNTNQILTVPYAFHAKTAETLTVFPDETDPLFTDWNYNYHSLRYRPTHVSAFINDVGYVTPATETDPRFFAWGYEYDSLRNKPTHVSAFINDVGYVTPATETDPRFFAWGYEYDSLQNKPTKVSTFDNDAGYVTTEIQNLDSVLTLGNRGGNKQIKDLAAPTDPNDAVTKIFLENYASLRVGNCDTLFLGDSQWVIIPGISIPNGKFNIAILTTDTISNITSVTATSGGNVTFDGNSPVTARGVCWSTSQNPTTSDPHTTDGNNLGTFTSNITNLTPNTTYYVRAYATNDIGTAYGNEVSFTTPDFPPNCGTVTDRDGNVYKTVIIGSQCWMRENLRTTKYADGTAILLGTSTNSSTPYRYYPNNNSSNVSTYGYLYNLAAALYNEECSSNNPSGVQGICPDGWHLPSSLEWWDLRDTLQLEPSHHCNDDDQNLAKALASSSGWNSHDGACTVGNDLTANNSTGFSSVPAGFYNSGYFNFGEDSYMWTTTGNKNVYSIRYTIKYNEAVLGFDSDQAHKAYSVRCVRNE